MPRAHTISLITFTAAYNDYNNSNDDDDSGGEKLIATTYMKTTNNHNKTKSLTIVTLHFLSLI